MEVNGSIRRMMASSGTSGKELSERIGRSPHCISATLCSNSSHKVEILAEIASAMGYQLILEGRNERIPLCDTANASEQDANDRIG